MDLSCSSCSKLEYCSASWNERINNPDNFWGGFPPDDCPLKLIQKNSNLDKISYCPVCGKSLISLSTINKYFCMHCGHWFTLEVQ